MTNFMKIRPVGAELFHADGRTDMTKLKVPLHKSGNVSQKVYNCTCSVRGYHVVPHSKQLSRWADTMALR